MIKPSIKGISYFLPPFRLTNESISEKDPSLTPDEIFKRTGVRERRKVNIAKPDNYLASDFAKDAVEKFFSEHSLRKNEVDFIILCSEGMDYRAPATSCIVQHKTGLPVTAGAIDLQMGCSGYVYGLAIASSLIRSGVAKNILFIAQELSSYIIHPDDTELVALFGDASSVSWISSSETDGIGEFILGTDGKGEESLSVRGSAIKEYPDQDWYDNNRTAGGMTLGRMQMNGYEMFSFSLRTVPNLVIETLEKNNLTMDEIDLFVFHQSNRFVLETLRKKLNIPEDKFFIFMETVGNTVATSIPLALREAMNQGKIQKGARVLIAGFGIGYSWGGTVLQF